MKKIFLLLFLMTISLGQSQNMISNSYFTNNTTGWTATPTGSRVGGEMVFSSTASAGNPWDTELKWTGLTLTNAATYTVTFRAKCATGTRNVKLQFQSNAGWGVMYSQAAVPLTTTMTAYTYTFASAGGGAGTVEMQFHMAAMGSTVGITFDDITLVAGTATQCTNFIQDADETGIDCGGVTCAACKIDPTYGAYTVGPKLVGDAPFSATATSDSPVAFTYASNTPSVATIHPTTGVVTVVGAGSTLITASQVADATYNAGSTSATLTVSFAPPATNPTTPIARNAWDVVSIYSGEYTATPGVSWAGTESSEISISGNNVRRISNFTAQTINFTAVNVSAMTTLHMDVYSMDTASNLIWLFRPTTGDRQVTISTPINGWRSIDIALTGYSSQSATLLAAIEFLKFQSNTGANKTVFIDNIYFYRAATLQAPTITGFTVPATKVLGDAPFNLTDPSSNSSGAFTYTSSNTAVATVSGNAVTVVGIGTTTITANQAADGSYSAGSATGTLNVTALAPTIAAPTPPARNAWDVISVYSGAYTPVAGTRNYNPDWGSGSGNVNHSQPTPGGDAVLKYQGILYQGMVIGSTINATATGMTHVHIDIWSINRTTTDFRLIDGAQRSKVLTTAGGVWNSFDIPLTDFVGLNATNIFEMLVRNDLGNMELYIDNIYFFRAATLLPPTFSTTFTVPAKLTNSAPFALTPPTSNSAGTFSYTSSNTAVATVIGNTVTIVGSGTSIITATQAEFGTFGSLSAPATLTVTFPVPTVAAPTPTVPAINVISLFSNAYTNQAGTDFNPNWGQATSVADVAIAGNTTKRYSTLNYQGTQFTTINGVTSNLQSIHFDFLSPNTNLIKVSLISNTGGGEKAVLIPTTPLNSWKSVDILLTQFSSQGLNLTGLFQLKIENYNNGGANNGTLWVAGGELYIDNIYFSDVVTNVAPIISGFTMPIKLVGDAPFNITTPTSPSAGAFTYTSSNTNVATISGNTVTIIGAGTSVITATQAANGSYTSGTATSNLVVSGNPATSAGNPTRSAVQVSSVFSNPYLNAATSYDNYGGPATTSSISVNGNNTLKIGSMGRLGINLTGGLNVSGMKNLHIDIYSPNATKFNLIMINLGVQTLRSLTTTLNGWNRFDLSITGVTRVEQILLVASPDSINTIASTTTTGVAFVDNVYFWTDVLNLTQLRSAFCGKTLATLSTPIEASPLAGATEYTFEVTRVSNNAVTTIVSANYLFNPASAIPGGLVWGAAYSIKVKAKVGGIYSAYGNACIVTAPAEPLVTTTQLRAIFCGKTMQFMTRPIEAGIVYLATTYEFEVTSGAGTFVATSGNYKLNLFNAVPGGALYNTAYTVRVRSKGDATAFTAWGDPCVVTTPSARMSEVSNNDVFEVKSFPNPFASHFNLDIESSSDAQVEMKVYDMIGRQLEVRKASVSEMSVLEVGRNYPTGIYNLVVSQGKNVKSIRMIKK